MDPFTITIGVARLIAGWNESQKGKTTAEKVEKLKDLVGQMAEENLRLRDYVTQLKEENLRLLERRIANDKKLADCEQRLSDLKYTEPKVILSILFLFTIANMLTTWLICMSYIHH